MCLAGKNYFAHFIRETPPDKVMNAGSDRLEGGEHEYRPSCCRCF